MTSSETIVAIATPPGAGGVGIVRLSGSNAWPIALRINGNKPLEPRYAHYCHFYNEQSEIVDAGLMLGFKAPNSFTGEDIVELQGHGSPVVLNQLVNLCVQYGARLARPGEFSERAFLNDRMDLVQAEAIADLISASSQTAARMAVRSLQGEFSARINRLNEQLIYLRSYVEAALDFPEEEIDFLQEGTITGLLSELIQAVKTLLAEAAQGVIFQEGIQIVIAGKPNAGKSTLINALAGKPVAIVTDIAGTTRDIMRADILLDDIPVHIMDTAGIRESEDKIEQEGIKRAWEAIQKADCVLMVIDLHDPESSEGLEQSIKQVLATDIPIITLFNKIDSLQLPARQDNHHIYLSAKSGEGMHLLKSMIKTAVGCNPIEGQFMARPRHLHALEKTCSYLLQGEQQSKVHKALELLAEDLRLAHEFLCTITGEFTPDDLLGKIFSSFCIGK